MWAIKNLMAGPGIETSGVSKMSLDLILLKPSGEHERLSMTQLCGSVLEETLLTPWLRPSGIELTSADIASMATDFARFLDGYRLDHPAFPRKALLQFTELGPYWVLLVIEVEKLYESDDVGFDIALDELMATIQVDMEEDHLIPYEKHRHYDTLLCFKAEYNAAAWRRGPTDIVLQLWDYEYIMYRRIVLESASEADCLGMWVY
jgi:hypothetical protein